jgi:rare lipoprotein A (peptidoglycan hydrolase)
LPFYKVQIIKGDRKIERVLSSNKSEREKHSGETDTVDTEKPTTHTVSILYDGEPVEVKTSAETVGQLAEEAGLRGNLVPIHSTPIFEGLKIHSFPIESRIEESEESIPFKTERIKDSSLEKGKETVSQEGENGTKKLFYEVHSENGVEVSRTLAREEVTKEPVNKIIKVGTKVEQAEPPPQKTEKKTQGVSINPEKSQNTSTQSGVCALDGNRSWYDPGRFIYGKTDYQHNPFNDIGCYPDAQQGYASHYGYDHKSATGAASTRYPWGTKLRVTNLSNGKSTIVTVNDWGPFVSGRVIDMSQTSFSKIASPSEGIINVRVEPV